MQNATCIIQTAQTKYKMQNAECQMQQAKKQTAKSKMQNKKRKMQEPAATTRQDRISNN